MPGINIYTFFSIFTEKSCLKVLQCIVHSTNHKKVPFLLVNVLRLSQLLLNTLYKLPFGWYAYTFIAWPSLDNFPLPLNAIILFCLPMSSHHACILIDTSIKD